jgi:hypothetical protein
MTTAVDAVDEATELEAAQRALRALEVEQAGLPAKLTDAAREADGSRLLALRRRREEVAAEVFSAKARVLRLQIEVAERRRVELKKALKLEEEELLAAAQVAREAYDFAKKKVEEHSAVVLRMRFLENDSEIERVKANELRQELAALVREASGEGGEQVINFGARTGRPLTSPGR